MGCADANTIAALIANALDETERAEIAIHAATCASCHEVLDGLLETASATVEEGARIGRYMIGERLGAGGMGVVFAALDSELHRRVAIKLLRADGADEVSTEGRERLMREARALASLSHPNVVTVFDVGAHEGTSFIAMELVDGGNLRGWLRAARRSPGDILDRLIDAGRGLAAAHAAGVVHRDVKPDNVLVGSDGRARVTDFGLARVERAPIEPHELEPPTPGELADLTRTGVRMGTPSYMAPEQLGSGRTGPRADQWSYCAMIYEVLAGVRPFPTDDAQARAEAIEVGRLTPPAPGHRVPGWIERIVARGLRADPDARWPSVDAVVAALERGRRRRSRIVRGSAVAAVALAAATWLVLATRHGAPPAQAIHLPDSRAGCHCPLSACSRGTCQSVCRAGDFVVGAPIPGVSVRGRQEALLGVSGDGDAILYLAGQRCAIDRLMLARRRGDTYESVDLTDKLDRGRVALYEGCCTLAADGASMLLARSDRRGFVRVGLSGFDVLPRQDGDDLGALVPTGSTVTVQAPVLSADELTLYYRANDDHADARGPLDAPTFASHRAQRRAPFAPGERLSGRARYYDYVSGVSSDQLSLFMESEYRTHVLVRASVDEPFGDPSPELGMLPALLPGWRSVPTADCRRIATTWTPGGCESEDIVWLEAKTP